MELVVGVDCDSEGPRIRSSISGVVVARRSLRGFGNQDRVGAKGGRK